MVNPLLERTTPEALARRGQVIEKQEKLELFPRLTEAVQADLRALETDAHTDKWRQAPVAIRLSFGWADTERELPALEGHAEANLPAVCQRCLEPFELPLVTDFKLLFRGPAGRAEQSADYEVWELDEPEVRPLDIVDEALVIAMPFAALHKSPDACGLLATKEKSESEAQVRPFADLKSQMRNRD